MSKRKVYGVNGLMEWIAIIMCGQAKVKVPFTGGSLSGYGVTPARYTTENPFIQHVIENSDYFKSGKIQLLHEMEGTGKYKEQMQSDHADAGTHLPGQAATASAVMESALNPDGMPKGETCGEAQGTVAMTEVDTSGTVAETAVGDESPAVEGAGAPEVEEGKTVVEVRDLDDAKNYLVEEFEGVTMSSLRSKVSVLRCAEEHNIVFKGLEE